MSEISTIRAVQPAGDQARRTVTMSRVLAGVAVATAGLAEVRLADELEIRVETHELRIPVTGGMQ